jgi:predicted transcriptional regulator
VQSNRQSYTAGMKTAVSIPEPLYESAERLARQLRRSRSRLYADALREYVVRHDPDSVTRAIDQVLAELGSDAVSEVSGASRQLLKRVEW